MPVFRKKPVEIHAWPVRDLIRDLGGDLCGGSWKNLPEPVEHAYLEGKIIRFADQLHIHTLEGIMAAGPDDMLIRGVKGELYPCKADIFAATYDPLGYEPAAA
jgi:hypothetical protein